MKKRNIRSFAGLGILLLAVCILAGSKPEQKFKQPLLVTSAGQSAEVQLVSVLAKRADLRYTLSKLAAPSELDEENTLVLSLGVSLKGLGAAGVDIDQEKERVTSLLKRAQETNKPLICIHLGGEARRGQLSDDFVKEFLPHADAAIVVKSGNQDNLFTNICQENNIPMIEVDRAIDALQPFQEMFTPLEQ